MLVRLHTLEGFHQPRELARGMRLSRGYELTIDADSLNLAARFSQLPLKVRPSILIVAALVLATAVFTIAVGGWPDYRGLGTGLIVATALALAGAFWQVASRLLGRSGLDDAPRPYREVALSEIESALLDGRDIWLCVHTLELKRTLILRHRSADEAIESYRRLRDETSIG